MQNASLLAAIDIGSNSCLLELGHFTGDRLVSQTCRKETIRLGGSLDAQGQLSAEAMERGWACLQRFAPLIADLPPERVRAVATQTLREATNRAQFLARGSAILGVPIEVIGGEEEARLIYQGVARLLPPSSRKRLVIDIGGRSTELCLGQGFEARITRSVEIGSVAWSLRHFADGGLRPEQFAAAKASAQAMLQPQADAFAAPHWEQAYGASGTAGAISRVLAAQAGTPGLITRQGLDWLQARLQQDGHSSAVHLAGLREELRPVIGGGVSVMQAVFQLFGIDEMRVTQGSLRHGLLYSLRPAAPDVR
ncbi:Ppx/GppA family phosphatase [Acidovorax sp. CCYZU-2555]|uniref:Ppx/GppA family phosphatase n=1 Tax=Acidovorax sp. CCYZU-2555 TaxID=2835042 RepID=UPI001BD0F73A|nr:Ppx/GppA family phosphatase [Acidovorax sp. CCYZU-2555]MBS7776415.1 Ppx/GppA family phosphatase [Acidovorax sp. CCYZU-2555]